MILRLPLLVGVLLLMVPLFASAQSCAKPPGYSGTIYSSSDKIITYYVPHNAPNCKNSIEGCIETSCPGLPNKIYGEVRLPTCLDAVRLGQAKYVTLASDASNYGKYYYLGTITYRSWLDRQMHTVNDVIGYVHDTGGAFRGRPNKIDVCTTVCPECTDSQAGALAQGQNVSRTPSSQGVPDYQSVIASASGYSSPFTPAYGSPFSANPFSPAQISPYSAQGAQSGQGAYSAQGAYAGQGASAGQSPFSVGTQLIQGVSGSNDGGVVTGAGSLSASTIVVQPRNARAGDMVLVSWTSVNMQPASCKILKNEQEFAKGNEATKRDVIERSVEYTLECTTTAGVKAVSKANISL